MNTKDKEKLRELNKSIEELTLSIKYLDVEKIPKNQLPIVEKALEGMKDSVDKTIKSASKHC